MNLPERSCFWGVWQLLTPVRHQSPLWSDDRHRNIYHRAHICIVNSRLCCIGQVAIQLKIWKHTAQYEAKFPPSVTWILPISFAVRLCRNSFSSLFNVTNGPQIFLLQLHTTMSRNLVSVNTTVTAAPLSRDLLLRGKGRNFRQVNRDISRKELETKTREEIRYRGVAATWWYQFRSS